MGLLDKLFPQRDAKTLYFSVVELPQPRDWGDFDIAIGKRSLATSTLRLDASAVDEVERLIDANRQAIQASGHQNVVFENVAPWAKARIEQKLQQI